MATIPDKVNTGALATIVAVGAISMVGISAALTAMVRSEVDNRANEVGAKSNPAPFRALKDLQNQELNAPAKRGPTGRVVIPIDRAMVLVVEDLKQHPERATDPPPPDAGKKAAEADAGADPTTADAAAAGEAGAEPAPPTEGTPAPDEGAAPPPPPTPEDHGAAPVEPGTPKTGNGKPATTKKVNAEHAHPKPSAPKAAPEAPSEAPPAY